jgi:broad specificity phosphatase PhoE
VKDSLTIQYDERLKELNFGKWEGRLWSDLIRQRKPSSGLMIT